MPEKIVFLKAGGVKNVINSTQYQRALLLSQCYELTIVTDGDVPRALEQRAEASFRISSGWSYVASAVRLLRKLSKQGYHVVYSSNQPRAIISSYLATLFFSFCWIVDLWDDPMLAFRNMRKGSLFTKLYRRFLRHSLPRADAWILGLHEDIMADLPPIREGFKILKITNGTVVSHMKREDERNGETGLHSGGPLRVGYAGWVTLQRGIDLVLELLKSMKDEDVQFLFKAWGPGEDDALGAIEKHNAQSKHKLQYLGKISHEKSLNEVAKSDVCLCILDPSVVNFRYSYPIKLFEYMAAGKVVIASDTPAIREVIEDGTCGFLIDNSVDSLREALKNVALMNENGEIKAMEEAARVRVRAFDWKDINKRIVQFLTFDLGFQRKDECVEAG